MHSHFFFQWCPSGDAFIIGSDLKRLESETLPQFFRHNRFQSLVRQLNFYSFRKINRERNVWIYKHSLFHRDRPQDLHLVRRRTCPGLDGRKQRFSRFSARKLSQNDVSEDDSSIDSVVEDVVVPKRKSEAVDFNSDRNKRMRRFSLPAPESIVVDTTVIEESSVQEGVEDYSSLGQSTSSANRKDIAEQSLIVSEVASKLEEFVRKAMKGRVGGKRRGQSGVVTPPYGHSSSMSTAAVLSYDDEYPYDEDDVIDSDTSTTDSSLKIVTSDRASGYCMDSGLVTPSASYDFTPFSDTHEIESITRRIFEHHTQLSDSVRKSVLAFCLANSPHDELDSKIFTLISSCKLLAADFQQYCKALHPTLDGGSRVFSSMSSFEEPETILQVWERETCRRDAVRDFKTFVVNCIDNLLCEIAVSEDRRLLERTARFWRDSIRI